MKLGIAHQLLLFLLSEKTQTIVYDGLELLLLH
jgi:hypothetical protein